MIITKTPLRLSFLGGGSDIPSFIERNGMGRVINTTIDKYVYVLVKKRHDDAIYLKYSENEIIGHYSDLDLIQHDFIRETLKFLNINHGLEIINWADIPTKGTGLGSSSSFLLGLLSALYHLRGEHVTQERLAREACHIEINLCKKPIGYQDQFCAAMGGINIFEFYYSKNNFTIPYTREKLKIDNLSDHMIVWYTGTYRNSSDILSEQSKNMTDNKIFENMKKNVELAQEGENVLTQPKPNIIEFGKLLNKNWELKKTFAQGISNRVIDLIYSVAMKAGAAGGKLTGAGGGGFVFFISEVEKIPTIRKALSHVTSDIEHSREMKINLDPYGTRILIQTDHNTW